MDKLKIDGVTLTDARLTINPKFGIESLEGRDDCGLVSMTCKVADSAVEYSEWYSVSAAKIETNDCMFPNHAGAAGERLEAIIDELQEDGEALQFYEKLDEFIETEIVKSNG